MNALRSFSDVVAVAPPFAAEAESAASPPDAAQDEASKKSEAQDNADAKASKSAEAPGQMKKLKPKRKKE